MTLRQSEFRKAAAKHTTQVARSAGAATQAGLLASVSPSKNGVYLRSL